MHLLHVLTQQLKVPISRTKAVAEDLLDASLICPLGGEYQLIEDTAGAKRWASSAWLEGKQKAHEQYVSPLMNWLRGFNATVAIHDDRVVAQGTLDIQRSKQNEEGGIQLPLFDFFDGIKSRMKPKPPTSIQTEIEEEELPPLPPRPTAIQSKG